MVKKGSPLTKSASGRSRATLRRRHRSRGSVLALSTGFAAPMARRSGLHVSHSPSVVDGLAGLTSTATRARCGHQLAQQFQPLCRQLGVEKIDTR